MWEKEEILVAFSVLFSHNFLLCTHFPKQALVFTFLQQKTFENISGKGEIASNEQFLFFHSFFYPF